MVEVGDIINKANGILPNSWLELKALQMTSCWSNNFEIILWCRSGLFMKMIQKYLEEHQA